MDSNANFASKIVKTVAPKMAGIARKNEKLAASFFAMPRINAVVMVMPDLEIPGIIANAWAIPIRTAILILIAEEVFFDRIDRNKTIPVKNKACLLYTSPSPRD